MKSSLDILIFAEDPGAANCLADLPAVLSQHAVISLMFAAGLAKQMFKERGIICNQGVASDLEATSLLISLKPRLLVVGTAENPDTLGLQLIDVARKLGIESIAIVETFD